MGTNEKHTPDYRVTHNGKVFSMTSNWRGLGERELTQYPNSHGYMRVRMTINGKRVSRFVHKLVAHEFLSPRPTPTHEVCHKDGERTNNNYRNLRWGTPKDNANDRERHGRTSRGLKHSLAIKRGIYEKRA